MIASHPGDVVIMLLAAAIAVLAVIVAAIRSGALAWLGGARAELLERSAVDTPAFTARGIAATIPALFGTLAMTAALEYGQQLSLIPAAAGGAAWGMIILFFDLSIMSADLYANSVWSWMRGAIFLALRATASVLAALVISSMIALFWYRTDITTRVQRDNQAAAAAYDQKYLAPHYTPQIEQDQAQTAADQRTLKADAQAVANDTTAVNRAKLLVQCEAGGVSNLAGCPGGSGKVGKGTVYAVRVAEYQNALEALSQAQAAQQADQTRLLPQISQNQANATALQSQQDRAEAAELAFQTGHDGLLARQRALSELEAANPGVGAAVKAMELLIVIIDCSAVIAKITSQTSAYDRVVRAEIYETSRRAERDEAVTDTEARIHDTWCQAIGDVAVARIDAWRDGTRNAPGGAGQQKADTQQNEQTGQDGGRAAGPESFFHGPSPDPPVDGPDASGHAGQQQTDPPRNRQDGDRQPGPEPPSERRSPDPPGGGMPADNDPFAAIRDRLDWEEER
jgi:Domain of unknown function (DUF4407)